MTPRSLVPLVAFVLACFTLAQTALPTLADPQNEAQAVLDQSAAAMGEAAFAKAQFVRVTSRVATGGLHGTGETVFDAKSGHYRDVIDLGIDKEADGYDGEKVWAQDNAGQVAIQGGDDATKGAINTAYQNAHGYWHRDSWPADITYSAKKAEGARRFDVLRIVPRGGRPFDLWIDATTHIIDRTVEQAATVTNTTIFGDWRPISGVLVAYKLHQTNGEAKYDTDISVEKVAFPTNVAAAIFSPPSPPRADFGFTGDKTTTVPFTLINNHMYVEVKLNGKPFELLFDTGGSNVITPTIAAALGLKPQGAFQGGGAGEKTQDIALVKVDRMEIGGAHLDNQVFAVSALESFGTVEGRPFTGIFGYEVFKRFIVKTDYENGRITLSDPTSWKYAGTGTRTPFQLKETIPVVPGEIDGIAGTFQIDTGSRSALDLMTPFVEKNNLVAKFNATMKGVSGWGIGGPAYGWFVRGHRFTFGGVSVDSPVVTLSQQKKGAFSDIYIAGNVGAGVLRRFNITWDYPHNQIFFEPNRNYAARDVFDRAGLWANLAADGFDVIDVIAGAPAAEGGLKAGDKIISVDGKKAGAEITLPEFRLRLKEAAGTKIKLDIARGTRTQKITVTLRDLV